MGPGSNNERYTKRVSFTLVRQIEDTDGMRYKRQRSDHRIFSAGGRWAGINRLAWMTRDNGLYGEHG